MDDSPVCRHMPLKTLVWESSGLVKRHAAAWKRMSRCPGACSWIMRLCLWCCAVFRELEESRIYRRAAHAEAHILHRTPQSRLHSPSAPVSRPQQHKFQKVGLSQLHAWNGPGAVSSDQQCQLESAQLLSACISQHMLALVLLGTSLVSPVISFPHPALLLLSCSFLVPRSRQDAMHAL